MWVDRCDDRDLKVDEKYAKFEADDGCTAKVTEMKAAIGTRLNRVASLVLTHDTYDRESPAVMNIITQLYNRISDMDIQEQKDCAVIRSKLKDLYQAVIFSDEIKEEQMKNWILSDKREEEEEEKREEQKKIAKAEATSDKDRFRDRLVDWAQTLYEDLCTDAECVMYQEFLDQDDAENEKNAKDESAGNQEESKDDSSDDDDDDDGESVRYDKYLSEEGRLERMNKSNKEIQTCVNHVINLILSDRKPDSSLSTIAAALLSAINKRVTNLARGLPDPTSENPTPYLDWEGCTRAMVKDLYHAIQFSVDCNKVQVAEKKVAAAAAAFSEGKDDGDDDDDDDDGLYIDGEMYVKIYNKGLMPFQEGPPEIKLVLETDEEMEKEANDDDGEGVLDEKMEKEANDDDREGVLFPLFWKKIDVDLFARMSEKGMLPFQDGPLATEAAAVARAVATEAAAVARADKDAEAKDASGAAEAARAEKDDDVKEAPSGHIMDPYVCLWDETPGLTYAQWTEKKLEERKRAEEMKMLSVDDMEE